MEVVISLPKVNAQEAIYIYDRSRPNEIIWHGVPNRRGTVRFDSKPGSVIQVRKTFRDLTTWSTACRIRAIGTLFLITNNGNIAIER